MNVDKIEQLKVIRWLKSQSKEYVKKLKNRNDDAAKRMTIYCEMVHKMCDEWEHQTNSTILDNFEMTGMEAKLHLLESDKKYLQIMLEKKEQQIKTMLNA